MKERYFARLRKYSLQTIACGIPRGSVGWPLLFPILVNNATVILNPIIFADDTSFFICTLTEKYLFESSEQRKQTFSNTVL